MPPSYSSVDPVSSDVIKLPTAQRYLRALFVLLSCYVVRAQPFFANAPLALSQLRVRYTYVTCIRLAKTTGVAV